MSWDNIEHLLQKYYEGETSVEEEKQLQSFFNQGLLLPDHLKVHQAQFQFQAQQQEEQLDKFLSDDWLFEKIEKPETIKSPVKVRRNSFNYWGVAASIVLLIGVFWAGSYYRNGFTGQDKKEVAAIREELTEMKKVLAAGTISNEYSASERIRVVSQDFNEDADTEVINILITTLNSDPNVNVRLAACEALYKYGNHEVVRSAFINALQTQKDPLVQITLIDMLVNLKEKKAIDQLKVLADKESLLPIVRNKAEQGIGILI